MARDLDVTYLADIARRIRQELDRSDLPDEPHDALLYGYAVLALAVGRRVTLANVHDAWAAWMMTVDPEHDAIVPFAELDPTTAAMDQPFADAIRAVASEIGR